MWPSFTFPGRLSRFDIDIVVPIMPLAVQLLPLAHRLCCQGIGICTPAGAAVSIVFNVLPLPHALLCPSVDVVMSVVLLAERASPATWKVRKTIHSLLFPHLHTLPSSSSYDGQERHLLILVFGNFAYEFLFHIGHVDRQFDFILFKF